jgi:hypothetical protein
MILPIFSVVIIFIDLGGYIKNTNQTNALFFIVLGCIPKIVGIISIFILKDSSKKKRIKNQTIRRCFLWL